MSYEKKSIYEVINEIQTNKFLLPAIQRKFVWDEERIYNLFDSILRGYPIGNFLFWFLDGENANQKKYVFYKFLSNYDERNPYNEKKKPGSFRKHDEIIGVLDGQQRLSALNVGLQGKWITKTKYKHRKNRDAWPKRELYLNLLNIPIGVLPGEVALKEGSDEGFHFRFLEPSKIISDSIKEKTENELKFWFNVGKVNTWDIKTNLYNEFDELLAQVSDTLVKRELKKQKTRVVKTLRLLRDAFIKEKSIIYYRIDRNDLDDILNIFVRVNSGSVALSKSDLLFSTITVTWENGRDEIEELQKKLNEYKNSSFNFTNEFLMRSLLVLSDLEVLFKVNSFKAENVETIKKRWEGIKQALITTIDILSEAGLSSWVIPSQNAVIPIAYYIYKGGDITDETKSELIKYLKHAFLKKIFGVHGDTVLGAMRKALSNDRGDDLHRKKFSFSEFIDRLNLSSDKNMTITDEDLDEFLETKKNHETFLLLSMLYPNKKYGQVIFDQDHIHPASSFKRRDLKKIVKNETTVDKWIDMKDMLPNLQLLEGRENKSKNDHPLTDWLAKEYKDDQRRRNEYLQENFIDSDLSLELQNFEEFFEKRKLTLKNELKKVLEVKRSN